MQSPPLHPAEPARLALLHDTGLLDSPPDPDFDALARLLAESMGLPIALFSLVDGNRQWFKARVGLESAQTERAASFCGHAVADCRPLVVADARLDARFADNPLVTGAPHIRFYAGVPVVVEDLPLGTMCVIDRLPHADGARVLGLLAHAADLAAALCVQRLRAQRAERDRQLAVLTLAQCADWTWSADAAGRLLTVEQPTPRPPGTAPERARGRLLSELAAGQDPQADLRLRDALAAGRTFQQIAVSWPGPAGGATRVWLSGVPVRGRDGSLQGFRGVAQDPSQLQRAAQRAERAETLLHDAVEGFGGPVMMADADGRILSSNRRWRELLGRGEAAATVGTWQQAMRDSPHLRDAAGLIQRLDQAGAPSEWQAGGRWWLTQSCRLAGGQVLQLGLDITAAKDAEERGRHHAEIHRAVAESSADGVVVVDLAGHVLSHNAAAARLWRLQPAEMRGLSLFERAVGRIDDLGRAIAAQDHPVRQALLSQRPLRGFRMGVVRASEPVQWFDLDVLPLANTTEAVYVFRDVTEQRALHAVQSAQTDGGDAHGDRGEVAGFGAWQWDIQRGHLFLSRGWKQLIGQDTAATPDTLRRCARRVHREDLRRVAQALGDAVEGRAGTLSVELRLRHRDGRWRWMSLRGRIVRSDDGRALEAAGVMSDITAYHEAQQAHAERASAERANAAKSEFLSRVSHELRTPLNAVVGFARLLQRQQPPLALGVAEPVSRIHAAGQHLLRLVNDLLEAQRIESGVLPLSLEAVALRPLLHEMCAMCSEQAAQQGVALRVDDSGPDGLAGQADPQRLRQVLLNLIDNAVKYGGAGGRVDIGIRPEGARVLLQVRDHGPGLDAAQQARLFQPFERLGQEHRGRPGTGLGLVISRGLAQAMGGTLTLDSAAGAGCTFTLALPLAWRPSGEAPSTAPALPVEHARAARPRQQPRRTMFYVEDDPVNVLVMRALLEQIGGWTLRSAGSGAEALRMLTGCTPDLLVLDAQLPDCHGLDLLPAVRSACPHLAPVGAVMLTADAMPQDARRSLDAGFVEHWTKPMDIDEIGTRLARWPALAMPVVAA